MKTYCFLADGFETVEALAVIDLLRRAKEEVVTVSVKDSKEVMTSHQIPVMADCTFAECDFSDGDALFLPGGMPGTLNLEAHEGLSALINQYAQDGKYLIAICAAPSVLGHHHLLEGKKATCFPGFEKDLYGATATGDGVVVDGKIVTARGMGKAIDLGLTLISLYQNPTVAEEMAKTVQYR